MYRRTTRQVALLGGDRYLGPESRRRLEQSWALTFHQEVYPVLLRCEDQFKDLYREEIGRPNWSVARLLGLCVLQEWFGLTDQEALDALSFDTRWQVALGLTPEDAYLSRRSLVAFRQRLVSLDPEMKRVRAVFLALGQEGIARLKLQVRQQRLDSTRVVSNIRTRGRVDLFNKTLMVLMRWLTREHAAAVQRLPEGLVRWYNARSSDEGWEQDEKKEKAAVRARRLLQLATWSHQALQALASDSKIREGEPYQLLQRLFGEHCAVEAAPEAAAKGSGEGGGPGDAPPAERIVVRSKPEKPGSSLQSPHDPDAGYSGHKGSGYHIQVTETCGNKGPAAEPYQAEIITDYEVHSAGVSDQSRAIAVVERLEAAGMTPEVLVVDGGYVHGAVILEAQDHGVDLLGPASSGPLPADSIGRDQFVFSADGTQVLACPQGHAPVKHQLRTTNEERQKTPHARFSERHCSDCPLKGRCVARQAASQKGDYYLDISSDLAARDAALTRKQTPEFRQAYRIRSGIEATNSELKRQHGLGHLRVRRRVRVELAVAFKLMACNAKRWTRASQTRARAQKRA